MAAIGKLLHTYIHTYIHTLKFCLYNHLKGKFKFSKARMPSV